MGDDFSSRGKAAALQGVRGDRGSRMRHAAGLTRWTAPRPGEEPGTRAARQASGFATNLQDVASAHTPEAREKAKQAAQENLRRYHALTESAGRSAQVARERMAKAGPLVTPHDIDVAGLTNAGKRDRKALVALKGGKGTFITDYARLRKEAAKAQNRYQNMMREFADMRSRLDAHA